MHEDEMDRDLRALWRAMGGGGHKLRLVDPAYVGQDQQARPLPPHKHWRSLWTTTAPEGFIRGDRSCPCQHCKRYHNPQPFFITQHSIICGPIMPSAESAEQAALDYLMHLREPAITLAGPVRTTSEGTPL